MKKPQIAANRRLWSFRLPQGPIRRQTVVIWTTHASLLTTSICLAIVDFSIPSRLPAVTNRTADGVIPQQSPSCPPSTSTASPRTTITILKSFPTCLITQLPHQEKAKIDCESSTSKLFQTCEVLLLLQVLCHLRSFKTPRTNECRRMCHPGLNSQPQLDFELQTFAKCQRSRTLIPPTTITLQYYAPRVHPQSMAYLKTTNWLKYVVPGQPIFR